MIAIRVLSSHKNGLGHLYRGLRLADSFRARGQNVIMLPEDNDASRTVLAASGHRWRSFPFDGSIDWIDSLIIELGIRTWVNDRLATPLAEAAAITHAGAHFVTFDDQGEGSAHAAVHIAALPWTAEGNLKGKRVLRGIEYLVLDPEFLSRRRTRSALDRVLVIFGGTDTYGLTAKVAWVIRDQYTNVTVLFGPGAARASDEGELAASFDVVRGVPSLAAFFEGFDLAFTAGGITPFEANCSGLPCVIISVEPWERKNADMLTALGGAVHAGYRDDFDPSILLADYDVRAMSQNAIAAVDGLGLARVLDAIGHA